MRWEEIHNLHANLAHSGFRNAKIYIHREGSSVADSLTKRSHSVLFQQTG